MPIWDLSENGVFVIRTHLVFLERGPKFWLWCLVRFVQSPMQGGCAWVMSRSAAADSLPSVPLGDTISRNAFYSGRRWWWRRW